MRVLVDASTLIALGRIGELDFLTSIQGEIEIPESVRAEVSTEPANTNLRQFIDHDKVLDEPTIKGGSYEQACEILGEDETNGDVEIISTVLVLEKLPNANAGVISDDKRVRTVARGLGATVTGTIGVIVRAVEEYSMTADEGKDLVRRVDSHGLHMTGELREKAYELVEEAAENE